MKKIILILCSLILILSGCNKSEETDMQNSNSNVTKVIEGVAAGMKNDIKVAVTLNNDVIEKIDVIEISDTNVIKDAAINQVIPKIIENQSLNVDVATGATFTSFGIIKAVENALKNNENNVKLNDSALTVEKETVNEHENYDVVIVGSGMSGITTAIQLARNTDLKVVVLEKNSYPGGSSLVCGGGIWALGSKYNKEINKDASETELINFLKNRSDMANINEELIKNIYKQSKDVFEYLYDNGLPVSLETTSPSHPDTTIPVFWSLNRGKLPYETGESGVYDQVLKIAKDLGVEVRLNAKVTELLSEDKSVIGVKVEDLDKTYFIDSKKVVLATGGISRNKELVKKYASEFADSIAFVGAGSTGDGILLTENLKAKVIGEGMMGLKGVNDAFGYYGSIGGLVWKTKYTVNDKGETFGMEKSFYSDTLEKLINEEKAYGIFDSESDVIDRLEEGVNKNYVKKYSSLDELNSDLMLNLSVELKEGPYYVIDVKPLLIGSIIGLEVDENCRVIDENDEAIENLYAVGELMFANVYAKRYPGSGTGMGISSYSGSVAAEDISETLK